METKLKKEDLLLLLEQMKMHQGECKITTTEEGLWFEIVGEGFSYDIGLIEKDA